MKSLIEAAPELSSISKSKQAYGYKYATLDSLIDMLRAVLPAHGLWFIQMPTRVGEKSTLTTRVIHSSGEWLEDTIEMTDTELQGKVNDTQKLGASITYFRRYALSAIFGIASDEDVDGNLNNAQQKQTQKQPQAVTRPQPQQRTASQAQADAIAVIAENYKGRIGAGEPVESVLKSYAEMLKTDKVRKVADMESAEVVALATIIKRSKEG